MTNTSQDTYPYYTVAGAYMTSVARYEREMKEWVERGRTEEEKAAALKWLEDMRDAALEAAREDGWQPIETAPKDGTRVLLWFEWHDLPVVGDFRHGRWWSVHSLGGNLAHPNGMDWEEVVRPTYWRPLPAPPAVNQAREESKGA